MRKERYVFRKSIITAGGATLIAGLLSAAAIAGPEKSGTAAFTPEKSSTVSTESREARPEVGQVIFMKSLESLYSDEAPRAVRASEKQQALFEQVNTEWRQDLRAWHQANVAELRTLRRAINQTTTRKSLKLNGRYSSLTKGASRVKSINAKNEAKGFATASSMTPAEARARMAELKTKGPQIAEYQTRIWNALTGPQQAYLLGALADRAAQAGKPAPGLMIPSRGQKTEAVSWTELEVAFESLPTARQKIVMRQIQQILATQQADAKKTVADVDTGDDM